MKARVALLEAYEKGYRINNEGCAISPSGNKLRFRKAGKGTLHYILNSRVILGDKPIAV